MLVVTLRWLLLLFAALSGVAKLYGIDLERAGAEELDLPYVAIRGMGAVHVAAAGCFVSDRPVLGAMLLGTSYLPLVYVALSRGQNSLVWGCFAVMALTLVFTKQGASALRTDEDTGARTSDEQAQ
ncbi:MAG: hypothetical protein ACRBN8_05245 [Nannocystales bacterium]